MSSERDAALSREQIVVDALRMIAASDCMPSMTGACVGAVHRRRVRGTGPHTDPPTEREYREVAGCPKHYAMEVLEALDAQA